MSFYDASTAVASLLDAGSRVQQDRLDQIARLTAAKHWRRSDDEEWSRSTTYLFRKGGVWIYAVFPVYRRRYYAVVRVESADVVEAAKVLRSDHFEVRSVCVLEEHALRIACRDLAEEP